MKYFEFKEPYFALISAEDEKNAIEIYRNDVCEAEEGFEMEKIPYERAIHLINSAVWCDKNDQDELKSSLGLLLIDGHLV
ncbi:MAG: hypothetical protein RR565_04830 [Erysipelothrix sp.]